MVSYDAFCVIRNHFFLIALVVRWIFPLNKRTNNQQYFVSKYYALNSYFKSCKTPCINAPVFCSFMNRRIQKMKTRISFFLLFVSLFMSGALAQQTETRMLSGESPDDNVVWDFFCTEGRKSGEWTKFASLRVGSKRALANTITVTNVTNRQKKDFTVPTFRYPNRAQ